MKKPLTAAAYIAAAPAKARPMLRQLRRAIKTSAPMAEEKISYGMPYYGYYGRLIYFAAFTSHVGLYIMGASREALPPALTRFRVAKSTLRFPFGQAIPVAAVGKIVRAQMQQNEKLAKKK